MQKSRIQMFPYWKPAGNTSANHAQPTERIIPPERFTVHLDPKETAMGQSTASPVTSPQGRQTLYRPEFEHDACGIGALASIKGERSHQILDDALSVLVNLEHRGGAILFQVPHRFFRKEAQRCGHLLPDEGDYGVAMLFLPRDERGVADARRIVEEGCAACGIPLLF